MSGGHLGYADPGYAASFAEFGEPLALKRSGGWLLRRRIPGTGQFDAMGPYPLFSCEDWEALGADLDELGETDVVSVSLVADPFGRQDLERLRADFDRVVPFKPHTVYDLSRPRDDAVSGGHRRNSLRAARRLEIRVDDEPWAHLDDWCELYGSLIARHGLHGMKAFSRASFAAQLRVPGLVMMRALAGGSCVGAHLWIRRGEVAYSHLSATNDEGYRLEASYALMWEALSYFVGRVGWLNLGAGAGTNGAATGLTAYKRGWSELERWAYHCGKVLQPAAYQRLAGATCGQDGYFPVYRAGELS